MSRSCFLAASRSGSRTCREAYQQTLVACEKVEARQCLTAMQAGPRSIGHDPAHRYDRRGSARGSDLRPRHPEKAHRPDQPVARKPPWIRVRAPGSPIYAETLSLVRELKLATVCEEARCPNIGECWDKRHATFMIMGDTCTRACAFCNVRTGLPGPLDEGEPARVADAVAKTRPLACRGDLGRPRRPSRWRGAAFRAHDLSHPRRRAARPPSKC